MSVEFGTGRVELACQPLLEQQNWANLFSHVYHAQVETVVAFCLSDTIGPVLADGTRIFLVMRHAPRLYEEITTYDEHWHKHTKRTRMHPPQLLGGFALAMAVCLDLGSKPLTRQVLQVLDHYGAVIMWGRIPLAAGGQGMAEAARLLSSWDLSAFFTPRPGHSEQRGGLCLHEAVLQYLSIVGQRPYAGAVSQFMRYNTLNLQEI
jgi:hypothetical protein